MTKEVKHWDRDIEIMSQNEHPVVMAVFETVQAFGKRGIRLPWVCVSRSDWDKLFNEAETGGYLQQGPVISNGKCEFYILGTKIMCVEDRDLNIDSKATPLRVPGTRW